MHAPDIGGRKTDSKYRAGGSVLIFYTFVHRTMSTIAAAKRTAPTARLIRWKNIGEKFTIA